ncbi:MAG: DUF3263 domain-containing protein [Actinomycetota bacterium]|nr:DUF3263 domain-containing protein [Actinomycetota bacterium]
MPLTERDQAILDFERTWWTEPGTKAAAIHARFGLSSTRYYRLLGDLVGSADAAAYDPLVVRRLRKLRSSRRRARIEGSAAGQPPGR